MLNETFCTYCWRYSHISHVSHRPGTWFSFPPDYEPCNRARFISDADFCMDVLLLISPLARENSPAPVQLLRIGVHGSSNLACTNQAKLWLPLTGGLTVLAVMCRVEVRVHDEAQPFWSTLIHDWLTTLLALYPGKAKKAGEWIIFILAYYTIWWTSWEKDPQSGNQINLNELKGTH